MRRVPTEPRRHPPAPPRPDAYWVSELPGPARSRGFRAGLDRDTLCVRYSWSIPSPGDTAWLSGLLDGRGVVELGAGTGYWAWQAAQAGIDVVAYDPLPPGGENPFAQGPLYFDVQPGDQEKAAEHPGRALMMVWPPDGSRYPKRALHLYRGDLVICVAAPVCCADSRFWRILRRDWEMIDESPRHVSWRQIDCRMTAWKRRGNGHGGG